MKRLTIVLPLLVLAALALTPDRLPMHAAAAGAGLGHVTYSLANGTVYRLLARSGARPENISAELGKLSRGGGDQDLNMSPDGKFLVLTTNRFGCAGWACLAVVAGNISAGAAIKIGSAAVHADGIAAIASGGSLVVFETSGGPHQEDLWATHKRHGAWQRAILLTKTSKARYNQMPAISADGRLIVFDCGSDPYAQTDTQVCTVPAVGGRVSVAVPGPKQTAYQQPALAPDGSIVFERQTVTSTGASDERIWRLPPRSEHMVLVSRVTNDNSPCVLPDGRIVSLWLDRPGNAAGLHELKVMSENGSHAQMLLENVDVADIGTGCGG